MVGAIIHHDLDGAINLTAVCYINIYKKKSHYHYGTFTVYSRCNSDVIKFSKFLKKFHNCKSNESPSHFSTQFFAIRFFCSTNLNGNWLKNNECEGQFGSKMFLYILELMKTSQLFKTASEEDCNGCNSFKENLSWKRKKIFRWGLMILWRNWGYSCRPNVRIFDYMVQIVRIVRSYLIHPFPKVALCFATL